MRRLAVVLLLAATVATPAGAYSGARAGSCYTYARSAAVAAILARESHGSPSADNPRSSAFGCGQLLYGMRLKYGRALGINPNTRDPAKQMRIMHAYIDDRYGSDARALAFWRRHHWY